MNKITTTLEIEILKKQIKAVESETERALLIRAFKSGVNVKIRLKDDDTDRHGTVLSDIIVDEPKKKGDKVKVYIHQQYMQEFYVDEILLDYEVVDRTITRKKKKYEYTVLISYCADMRISFYIPEGGKTKCK